MKTTRTRLFTAPASTVSVLCAALLFAATAFPLSADERSPSDVPEASLRLPVVQDEVRAQFGPSGLGWVNRLAGVIIAGFGALALLSLKG